MRKGHFMPADILLPQPQIDLSGFAVVACDQYTSQPDYWERVQERTGNKVSAYHMIFPEIYLSELQKDPEAFGKKVNSINSSMEKALDQDVFYQLTDSMIYLERELKNGSVRKGLIGKIDLEEYDFLPEKKNYIRATEGTILERIPVRVQIRQQAPIELPHIMLLADDYRNPLISPLTEQKDSFRLLYDFELMEDGGRAKGWKLSEQAVSSVMQKVEALEHFQQEQTGEQRPMIFAVGDGNHSLAAAKTCYEQLKLQIGEEKAKYHPARYALVELVSLYDDSLEFEGIHRVVYHEGNQLWTQLEKQLGAVPAKNFGGPLSFSFVKDGEKRTFEITLPTHPLAVGCIQNFLDSYLKDHPGTVDYIHGEEVVIGLTRREDAVGLLLPTVEKKDLFPAVETSGPLPRKTFSMGEAQDKRFYLEGRKIK